MFQQCKLQKHFSFLATQGSHQFIRESEQKNYETKPIKET